MKETETKNKSSYKTYTLYSAAQKWNMQFSFSTIKIYWKGILQSRIKNQLEHIVEANAWFGNHYSDLASGKLTKMVS